MGIEDAIDIGDVPTCLEFCDRMYAPECFGRVVNDYKYSWREWKFRLSQIVFEDALYRKQGIKYFECITKYSSYIACVLPLAMDFYLRGIKDYCAYPNPTNKVKLLSQSFMIWGKVVTKVAMDDFVRMLTGFCYDRIRIDDDAIQAKLRQIDERKEMGVVVTTGRKPKGYKIDVLPTGLSRTSYENFQREIWRNTRVKEYKTRSR
jgi:hypothetical protein